MGLNTGEAGLEVVKAAYERNSEEMPYRLAYAEALMKLEQFKSASKLLDAATVDAKTPKKYWQLLVASKAKQKDENAVLASVEKWRKTSAYHVEPVIMLAEYWSKKGAVDRAITIINDAFAQHPKHEVLTLVKMQLLLDAEKVADARILYRTMRSMNLDPGVKSGIEGRIALLEKNYKEAVEKLEKFNNFKSTSQNTLLLAGAYQGSGQPVKAISLIEELLVKEPNNSHARNILASLYLASSKSKAINEYETLINKQPNNVLVLNNLSWLYMEQGKLEKSLEYAEKAYELAPEIPNVVDTYGQVLLKNNRKRDALQKAEEAYSMSKGKDTLIALNYVETLVANSRKNEAKKILGSVEPKSKEEISKANALKEQL